MRGFDVIVLGAGIVGCACAMECARYGLTVAIVEPGILGGGATAAGMGHVVVMEDSPALLALSLYSRQLWQELRPMLPGPVEYQQTGTLWIAADEEEWAEAEMKHRTYAAAGVRAQLLNGAEVAEREPNLRSGLAGGLLVPDDGVIYPPAAASYFLQQAVRGGAEVLRGQPATSAGAHSVVLADGTRLKASHIVLATGVDNRLLPSLPLHRRKGHLVITDRYPGFAHHQIVELGYVKSAQKLASDSVAFNIQPRRTGQLLLGSSRQYRNEDPAADPHILRQMLDRAQSYMPGLARLSVLRVWTGFRAATPDKLPYIGPAADPSLVLAMGFEGLGITQSLGAARLVVDSLLERGSAIDPAPYLPSRVMEREPSHA